MYINAFRYNWSPLYPIYYDYILINIYIYNVYKKANNIFMNKKTPYKGSLIIISFSYYHLRRNQTIS